jgi:hypothetical protein
MGESTSQADRAILRDLAGRVRDIASSEAMQALRTRWRSHNALGQAGRPMVLASPEGAWGELVTDRDLRCQDPFCRHQEWHLRARLYQHEQIADDTPIEATWDIPWKVKIGDYGLNIPFVQGDHRGSYVWDPPIKDLDRDLGRLKPRTFAVDRAATVLERDRCQELFGDLLNVRIHGSPWWTVGLTWDAALLVGLEQLMWAMCDQPEALHRLMAFLRDDTMRFIRWCEKEGLLSGNDGPGDYVGSGGFGAIEGIRHGDDQAPAALSQRWGFAESQETVGISPAMFEEFVLPYQLPLLESFALNCYGCCEGLERRIDLVLRHVPRLRRISVAPMADQAAMAAALGGKYIFSRKPNPAHVCVGFNEPAIRDDIRCTLSCAGDQPLELILKDTHTVENRPERIGNWVRIARQEIGRHYGHGGAT